MRRNGIKHRKTTLACAFVFRRVGTRRVALRIDEEFAALIPPLTDEEYRGLEASILEEGCRDALVCWGDVLVDGHNRYKICTAHGVPYDVHRSQRSVAMDVA